MTKQNIGVIIKFSDLILSSIVSSSFHFSSSPILIFMPKWPRTGSTIARLSPRPVRVPNSPTSSGPPRRRPCLGMASRPGHREGAPDGLVARSCSSDGCVVAYPVEAFGFKFVSNDQ